jgi:hypothetical protein
VCPKKGLPLGQSHKELIGITPYLLNLGYKLLLIIGSTFNSGSASGIISEVVNIVKHLPQKWLG